MKILFSLAGFFRANKNNLLGSFVEKKSSLVVRHSSCNEKSFNDNRKFVGFIILLIGIAAFQFTQWNPPACSAASIPQEPVQEKVPFKAEVDDKLEPQATREKKKEKLTVFPNANSYRFENVSFKDNEKKSLSNGFLYNLCHIDDRRLASVSESGHFIIWDKQNGQIVEKLKVCKTLWCLEKLPNNQGFLVGGDLEKSAGVVCHIDSEGKEVLERYPTDSSVISIAKQSEKTYWCGNSSHGPLLLDIQKKQFVRRLKYGSGVIDKVDENRLICGYQDNIYLIDITKAESVPVDQKEKNDDVQNPARKKRVLKRGKGFVLYRRMTGGWICHFESDTKTETAYVSDNNGSLTAFNLKNKRKLWRYESKGDNGISWFHLDKEKNRIFALVQEEALLSIDSKTGKLIKEYPIKGITYCGFSEPKENKVWIAGMKRPTVLDLADNKIGLCLNENRNAELVKNWKPGGVTGFLFGKDFSNWGITGTNEVIRLDDSAAKKFRIYSALKSDDFNATVGNSGDGILETEKGLLHFDTQTGKVLHTVRLRVKNAELLPDGSGIFISGSRYQIEAIGKNNDTGSEHEVHHEIFINGRRKSTKAKGFKKGKYQFTETSKTSIYTLKWGERKAIPVKPKTKVKESDQLEYVMMSSDKFLFGVLSESNSVAILDRLTFEKKGSIKANAYSLRNSEVKPSLNDSGYLYLTDDQFFRGILKKEPTALISSPQDIKKWMSQLSHKKYSVRRSAENSLNRVGIADIQRLKSEFPSDSQSKHILTKIIRSKSTPPLLRKDCLFQFQHEASAEIKRAVLESDSQYWLFLVHFEGKAYLRLVALVEEKPRLVSELEIPNSTIDCQLNGNIITILQSSGKRSKIKVLLPKDTESIEISN